MINGNSSIVHLAIVALKVIPLGTVLTITDQGWDMSPNGDGINDKWVIDNIDV